MDIFGKEINAAIFDMDGTMFDTERLRMDTLKQASLELFGERMSDQVLIDSLGLSVVTAEALAKKTYGEHYPYAEIRKLADQYEVAWVKQHGVPVKRSLIDVLERFKKNDILLAVATSSRREIVEEYLASANVTKYFNVVVCGDEVSRGKPHPEIFLKAAEKISCKPAECLIFEDSENGLRAAIASGGLPVYIKDIKDPPADVVSQAVFACEKLPDFLDELIRVTPKFPVPRFNERFPQSYNRMVAGIHGFGSIGGGFMAQIFSNWDGYSRPREIIGTTGDAQMRNIVNAFNQFTVNYESIAFEQTIKNVRLIDAEDEEKVIDMYVRAEIVALCLPESALRQQADLIARGLIARHARQMRPLTIVIALNKINAAPHVRRLIQAALERSEAAADAAAILADTYICETVVNRMVSRVPKPVLLKRIQNQLRRLGQEAAPTATGDTLPALTVDTGALIPAAGAAENGSTSLKHITRTLSNISDIQNRLSRLNIVLFDSEPDMVLYASNESPLLNRLRQVKPVDNIHTLQTIKNRLSNGTHAIIAWYSSLLGYETIGHGMGDERVLALANGLMSREIRPALLARHPELEEYIDNFIPSFVRRCRLSFKDPCHRVGRDPIRKLQKNERILGTLAMVRQSGSDTPLLEFGIALGLAYAISRCDPQDEESRILSEIYAARHSLRDVLGFAGEIRGKSCEILDPARDAELIQRVVRRYSQFQNSPKAFFDTPLENGQQASAA